MHHNGVEVVEEKIQSNTPSSIKNITDIIYDDSKVNFKYVLKPGIEISYVRKNSIADKAGLKVDDKIITFNGKKAVNYKLYEISEILQKNINETIVIEVERKGVRIVFELLLKEEI